MSDYRQIGLVTGVDLVSIDRVRDMSARWGDRFLCRCFTDRELDRCRGRSESLAANFAAKEAFCKATGRGLRGFSWLDIELIKDELNRPSLLFHRNAAKIVKQQGWFSVSVSLSHESGMAVAVVTALTGG
jgi:holo-[acyl-carrier protein] synthase